MRVLMWLVAVVWLTAVPMTTTARTQQDWDIRESRDGGRCRAIVREHPWTEQQEILLTCLSEQRAVWGSTRLAVGCDARIEAEVLILKESTVDNHVIQYRLRGESIVEVHDAQELLEPLREALRTQKRLAWKMDIGEPVHFLNPNREDGATLRWFEARCDAAKASE